MALDDIRSDRGKGTVSRAWERMVASFFNMFANLFERLGGRTENPPPAPPIADVSPNSAAAAPGDDHPGLLLPVIQIAIRQSELARETAEKTVFAAASRIQRAIQAAEQAEVAANRHKASRWQDPTTCPLSFSQYGLVYYGDFQNSEANGHGVFQNHTAVTFRGQVQGNRKHGFGVCMQGGQEVYEGEFDGDERHGYGRLEKRDYQFTGQFYRGRISGYGILVQTGTKAVWVKHQGAFEDAEANGHGIREYAGGIVHIGEFRNDMPFGFGIRRSGGSTLLAGRWEGEDYYPL